MGNDLQLVPQGIPGELHIGGVGLARGYINQQTLTAEKFIDNPLSTTHQPTLYKTGDLARHLCDGEIEYLGRIDHQIKIRGFRVELGEIEALLLAMKQVKDSVVIAHSTSDTHTQLVAYVVLSGDENEQYIEQIKTTLAIKLPDYMIPSQFVVMSQMPLGVNGKLDRKALPAPDTNTMLGEYTAPTNEIEQQLCEIWQDLLNIEQVGISQPFYNLGGDSLMTVRLSAKIKQQMGVTLSVMNLFSAKTIAQIAALIKDGVQEQIIHQLKGSDNAKATLLCVPYAAGDGLVFKPLADKVSDELAVFTVTSPRNFLDGGDIEQNLAAFISSHYRRSQKQD